MATNEHILIRKKKKKLFQAAQDGNDIYQKSIIVKTPSKNISMSIWMDDIGTETDLLAKVTYNWDFLHL
jgi:hypothetical protein